MHLPIHSVSFLRIKISIYNDITYERYVWAVVNTYQMQTKRRDDRKKKMEIEELSLDAIRPYKKNPRKNDRRSGSPLYVDYAKLRLGVAPFACSVRRSSPPAACGSYKPSRRRFVDDQRDWIRAIARIAGPASDRPVACGSCAQADVYGSAVRRYFLLRFWQAPTILCRQ